MARLRRAARSAPVMLAAAIAVLAAVVVGLRRARRSGRRRRLSPLTARFRVGSGFVDRRGRHRPPHEMCVCGRRFLTIEYDIERTDGRERSGGR